MPGNLVPFGSDDSPSFSGLLTRLGELFGRSQKQIEDVKVRTYWDAGRLIHGHILKHERRAGYGTQVIPKLSAGLGIDEHLLYRMVRFYEAFPILAARLELTWTHYRQLAQVTDEKKRSQLETRAAAGHWSARELRDKIRSQRQSEAGSLSRKRGSATSRLLNPTQGKVGVYRIVSTASGPANDFGFTVYQNLNRSQLQRHKPDDLITLSATGRVLAAPTSATGDLFTYRATMLRVVDGDTVWVQVWISDRIRLKQKLRLRGIDTPELDTAEGRAAKRAVESLFKKSESMIITTTKPDKWDRYLADVFLGQANGEELFLNNLLLAKGYARRMDKVAFSDWG